MKSSSFIINCARGPIVDESALYVALRDRKIAGAALDVMEQAAPPAEHPLFQLDNVLVTPHIAFLSQQSVHELEIRTAQAVVDVLQCRMPQYLVNPEVLPHARARLI
jgi:D-3-phosphoglycerate dehydrogenase